MNAVSTIVAGTPAALSSAPDSVWHGNLMSLDPAKRWPRFAGVFAAARSLALAVCWGAIEQDRALALLRYAPSVRQAPASVQAGVRLELAWAFQDALDETERDRGRAEHAMCRALAPLLDHGAPDAELRAAVLALNGGLFHPRELRALIETEKAWWIRLHATLETEAPRAA